MKKTTRREFLEGAGRAAAGLVVLGVFGCEEFEIDGEPQAEIPFITPDDPDRWFFRSAMGLEPEQSPKIRVADWRLDITAGGKDIASIDFQKLRQMQLDGHDVTYVKTMRCIYGTYRAMPHDALTATGIFRGIPLKTLLDETTISGETSKLRITAADGFRSSLPYDRIVDEEKLPVILAFELNGEPISVERGGPVRLVVPEMWGYKSVKWIAAIEATTDFSTFGTYETETFAGKGWIDNPGLMTLAPVITDPIEMGTEVSGPAVEIHGMAVSGGARIASVEVSVDGGDFVPAKLLSEDEIIETLGHDALLLKQSEQFGGEWPYDSVWVPWTATLTDLAAGEHELIIRATDSNGQTNPEQTMEALQLPRQVHLTINVV